MLCLAGFLCYWSWVFCALLSSSFAPQTSNGALVDTWLLSTIGHASTLAVLVVASKRHPRIFENAMLQTLAPAASLAGFALILVSTNYEAPSFTAGAGCLIAGFGTACWVATWANLFTACGSDSAKQRLLFLGVISSSLLNLLLSYFSKPALTIILMLLPIVGIIAIAAGNNRCAEERRTDSLPKSENDYTVSDQVRLSFRFILFCMVFPIPLGLFQTWFKSGQSTLDSWVPIFAAAAITLLVLFVASDAIHHHTERKSSFCEKLVMPVMVAGLFALTTFGSEHILLAGILVYAAQQIMDVVLYSQFGIIASRKDISPARVWGVGIIATDIGYAIGILACNLIKHLFPGYLTVLVLGVAYLIIMVAFLTAGIWKNDKEAKPKAVAACKLHPNQNICDSPVEDIATSTASPTSSSLANKEYPVNPIRDMADIATIYALTPRERELLDYLLRGKSVPAIASEVFLSPATVRTHISHIYRKFDVHSRDELVSFIESLVR